MLQSGLIKRENNFLLDLDDVKNIMVLEHHNHLGDMLCCLPLFASLKKKFSGSKITLVAAKTSYPIPFYEINPYVNEVLVFDKSNLKTEINFIRKLRQKKFQIGVVPSTIAVSRTLHIINYLAGAEIRAGVRSIDGVKNVSQRLLNLKSDVEWSNKHQFDRNLDIARLLDCDLTENEIDSLKFAFTQTEILEAKKYIQVNFPDKSQKIIGFHPGAGKKANTWNTQNFIDLIVTLYNEFNNYVIITKGKIDDSIVNEISKALDEKGIDNHVYAERNIKKHGLLLSLIDLYITNDTGAMHIAGFSNAKMISLFGPTNPKEWAPRWKNQYYIKSRTDDINEISVGQVFNLAKEILAVQ